MRLPQDRILHIDTEFKDGKVNIVAEWQGELVRCKDCKLYIIERNECTLHGLMLVYPEFYCRSGERRE